MRLKTFKKVNRLRMCNIKSQSSYKKKYLQSCVNSLHIMCVNKCTHGYSIIYTKENKEGLVLYDERTEYR